MYTIIRMEGDPTRWYAQDYSLPAGQPEPSGPPLVIPVVAPVTGTLLLSPSAFGSFALTGPLGGTEGMPSDFDVLAASLYLPSATGLTQDWTGYRLTGTITDAQQQITEALASRAIARIPVAEGGQVIINGAVLAFAVLCEPRS